MPKIIEGLAHNLPRIRKKKGLSQEELAAAAGVARGTIAKYETGVGGARLDTISRLAKALECEETDLVLDPSVSSDRELFTNFAERLNVQKEVSWESLHAALVETLNEATAPSAEPKSGHQPSPAPTPKTAALSNPLIADAVRVLDGLDEEKLRQAVATINAISRAKGKKKLGSSGDPG